MPIIIPILIIFILFSTHSVTPQQFYSPSVCKNTTSALGYSCNGPSHCNTYLIFRSNPPYTTLSSISSLLSSNLTLTSLLNKNISLSQSTELIIPITCSCSAPFYQSNTTYTVLPHDTPYSIASTTFQGATTCKAIKHQRSGLIDDIFAGEKLTIPIRCACPTANQSSAGINYLISYIIKSGDSISEISLRFSAPDIGQTLAANRKSVADSVIQPFTTLLVPLQTPPNSSMTETEPEPETPNFNSKPSPPPIGSIKKWNYFLYGLIAGGGIVLVFWGITFGLLRKPERKPIGGKSVQNLEIKQQRNEFLDGIAGCLKVYTIEELKSATDDFSAESVVGGSVYSGILQGRRVAIKKTQGDVSREIGILNKLRHFNVIMLVGVCCNNKSRDDDDDGVWYMVYEYLVNGRLSDLVFESSAAVLCWEKRVRIALDVATGLQYLHDCINPPLIHKDLKCSYVLVDEEYRAKISHFGLSRPVGEEEGGAFALTNHIVGTKGYMAPEFLENGLVTTKMDVYAFGILMAEIMSGKEAKALCCSDSVPLFDVLVGQLEYRNKVKEFMDPRLEQKYPMDVVTEILRLTLECLSKDPCGRPSMDGVVRLLSKALMSSTATDSISSDASTIDMSVE